MAFFNVALPNEVADEYKQMQLGHNYQYIILTLSPDLKSVLIDKKVEKRDTSDDTKSRAAFAEFVQELKEDDCRFAIFDFHYTLGESGLRDKLIFISWCPENAPMKKKMIFSSCRSSIKGKLEGIATEIQATDFDDLSYDVVKEKASQKK